MVVDQDRETVEEEMKVYHVALQSIFSSCGLFDNSFWQGIDSRQFDVENVISSYIGRVKNFLDDHRGTIIDMFTIVATAVSRTSTRSPVVPYVASYANKECSVASLLALAVAILGGSTAKQLGPEIAVLQSLLFFASTEPSKSQVEESQICSCSVK